MYLSVAFWEGVGRKLRIGSSTGGGLSTCPPDCEAYHQTIAQMPAAIVLGIFGQRFAGKRIGFVVGGGVASVALVLWFILPPSWGVLLSAVIGAASSSLFILGLSLPPLLAQGRNVAQVSGIMMGVGYSIAFFGSFIGGSLWDATGIPITAFLPVLAACVAATALSLAMPTRTPS